MESSPMKKKSYGVEAIQTPIFRKGEDLIDFIAAALKDHPPQNGDILAVTSKIVSLWENRLVADTGLKKKQLVQQESDHYLGDIGYDCHLTIKHGLMIASAGIDESNSEDGHYILFPERPFESAQKICEALKERFQLDQLGVLLTDSQTTPLRRGVTGVALSYWGFQGVESQVDQPDLFERKLQFTAINKADAMAAAVTMVMGEGADCCPLAFVRQAPVEFCQTVNPEEIQIPLQEDLYFPILKGRMENDSQ